MDTDRNVFRISIAQDDLAAFLEECATVDWRAIDTGERIMTDEGPDSEVVLLVATRERATAKPRATLMH